MHSAWHGIANWYNGDELLGNSQKSKNLYPNLSLRNILCLVTSNDTANTVRRDQANVA